MNMVDRLNLGAGTMAPGARPGGWRLTGLWLRGGAVLAVLVLALGCALPAAAPVAPPEEPARPAPLIVHTLTESSNVRAGPGVGHPVLFPVPAGAALRVLGRNADGTWLQIEFEDRSGWIHGPLTDADAETRAALPITAEEIVAVAQPESDPPAAEAVVEPPAEAPAPASEPAATPAPEPDRASLTVTGTVVNLRTGPGTDYATDGQVRQGDRLHVVGRNADGAWLRIEHPVATGAHAWIYGPLTDVDAAARAALPVTAEAVVAVVQPESDPPAAEAVVEPPAEAPAPASEPAATPAPEPDRASLTVTGTVVNLRKGPGTDYATDGQVRRDDRLHVVGRNADGTWLRIMHPVATGAHAWIYGPLTNLDAATARAQFAEMVLTIRYWQAANLPGWYLSGRTVDRDAGAITLEPLANYDSTGNLVPKLATEIPTLENGGFAEDGMSITWTLKEGVKWSDGSDFSADDVVFTWEYCTHPSMGCAATYIFNGVVNVEALDDRTVKISFASFTPNPYLPFVTAKGPIIQRAQFADCMGAAAWTCNEQNLMPHGTGPYRLTEFKVNDVAVYERNSHYHGEPAYFDRVVFESGGNAASAARAVLETGEAHYAARNLQIDSRILNQMEAKGKGKIIAVFQRNVERILVNQTNPDPALGDDRSEYLDGTNPHPFLAGTVIPQAMSMAIDRSVIATHYFAYQPTCNVIPGVSMANDDCLTQDIDGANALLDEAGIVDTDGDGVREYNGIPLEIRYQTSTNTSRQKTQALIKQWWRAIGIETKLLNHDARVFFGGDPNSPNTIQKFYADIQMYKTGPAIDPESHLAQWQCGNIPGRGNSWAGDNTFRGCDPEFDALFDQLVETPAGPERRRIIKDLNDISVQRGYQIPLVQQGTVSARANNLVNIDISGWDSELWNISDWALSE